MGEALVLGLGNNVDYEIEWDEQVLSALADAYDVREEELDMAVPVVDERSMLVSILSFVKSGAGGERFVASPEVIERFARRFSNKITLGGTSIRAAIALEKLGRSAALHMVTMNEHVRRLTPPGCPYVCSSMGEHVYPHLIVQFTEGARVRTRRLDVRAIRPNRIIYDNDPENVEMRLNEELAKFLTDAKVFLISGFNAMQSAETLKQRLVVLKRIMGSLRPGALVYYEDGGFFDDRLRTLICDGLKDRIDLHGMNEDELQGYLSRGVDLLDEKAVADALRDVLDVVGARAVVVHTRHWAAAFGQGAATLEPALAGGVALATTRFRFGDDFTVDNYQDTCDLPGDPQGAKFVKRLCALLPDAACVPAKRVSEKRVTTIGLGDAFVGGFLMALS
ncbi:MAG: ADP-dependent glucokinase/phosphofructokinase [Christensenellaceae bacterium]|nr:ADP-dependent glucokinase/phosphofructokinase [Christensenellaceae bacterium]MEA5064650.1 ADP-dependent glucokinase/phosphofructokinase [Eubacteriales bacterium]MEA5068224.1 ADP-dependent glucokinase/phosphofructokinase [Christensenellaceae bacterium]